jgi:hypothetical protein
MCCIKYENSSLYTIFNKIQTESTIGFGPVCLDSSPNQAIHHEGRRSKGPAARKVKTKHWENIIPKLLSRKRFSKIPSKAHEIVKILEKAEEMLIF